MNRHITAFLLAPLTVPLLMSVLALQNSEGGTFPLLAWSADRGSSFLRWRDSRGCSCVCNSPIAGPDGLLACPPDRLDGRCDHGDSSRRRSLEMRVEPWWVGTVLKAAERQIACIP